MEEDYDNRHSDNPNNLKYIIPTTFSHSKVCGGLRADVVGFIQSFENTHTVPEFSPPRYPPSHSMPPPPLPLPYFQHQTNDESVAIKPHCLQSINRNLYGHNGGINSALPSRVSTQNSGYQTNTAVGANACAVIEYANLKGTGTSA